MLKMVMMVHRTEEMWLSRNQDVCVRDGTLNYFMYFMDQVTLRSKFSCYFFRPCTMHKGILSFVINYSFKTF